MNDPINGRRVLYRFIAKPVDREAFPSDDTADEYLVIEEPKATSGGLVVYGKYHGKWVANPTLRPVVRQLLTELESQGAKCHHCGEPATKLCDFTIGYAIKGHNKDGRPYVDMEKWFTCDRPLCESCATTGGVFSGHGSAGAFRDTIDYCKEHAGREETINPQTEADLKALQRRLQLRIVELEGQEPTVDDVAALRRALVKQGESVPESIEECGVKWLSLVRRLVRSVERKV